MYQTTVDPLELLGAYLGRMFGSVVAEVLTALLALTFVFIVWGLPWERLIAKAGFTGRTYWFLLGLFFVPCVIGFVAHQKFGQHSDISLFLGSIFALSTYLGLLILAFCPWNVHRKLKQMQKSQ